MPFGFEFAFEVEIVFYDTIVDDGDPGFAVDQRVRVLLDWAAMGCPAGMSDTYGSGEIVEVVLRVDLVKSSAVLLTLRVPSDMVTSPTESYPRYSSRLRAAWMSGAASLPSWRTQPNMPHIGHYG